jgi:hypothetical protein
MKRRAWSDASLRRLAGIGGAAIFAGCSVVEIIRLVRTGFTPWPAYNGPWAWAISAVSIGLWLAAAFVLITSRQRRSLFFPVAGTFALVSYGILGLTGYSLSAVVYLAFGLIMTPIEWLAFGGKLRLWGPPIPPPPAARDPHPYLVV